MIVFPSLFLFLFKANPVGFRRRAIHFFFALIPARRKEAHRSWVALTDSSPRLFSASLEKISEFYVAFIPMSRDIYALIHRSSCSSGWLGPPTFFRVLGKPILVRIPGRSIVP